MPKTKRSTACHSAKHGLSFGEAKALFSSGVDFLEIFDEAHSLQEDRFWAVEPIVKGIIVVVYTERDDDRIRFLSARMATARERQMYEEYLQA